MELGNVIKKDICHPDLCKKSSIFLETLPILIALIIVAFLSGNLLGAGGMDGIATLVVECIFVGGLYALFVVLMNGTKKRMAQTGICVCENGICGVCPNGFQNRKFTLLYRDIQKVTVKKYRVSIEAKTEKVILDLADASATAALIQSKLNG